MALNVLVTQILSALGHKVTGSFPLLLITSTTTPGDLNSCLGESRARFNFTFWGKASALTILLTIAKIINCLL